MRINPIIEYGKYNEHRELNKNDNKLSKQNSSDSHISFSEVLKKVKQDTYLK